MTTPTELEDMRLRMEHFKAEAEALRSGACTCGLVKHFLAEGVHVADCASLVHKRIRAEALAKHEAEHRALVADNAAKSAAIQRSLALMRDEYPGDAMGRVQEMLAPVSAIGAGAAVLSELEALRKSVAELVDDLEKAKKFHTSEHKDRMTAERERDEARAQVAAARASALEEADAKIRPLVSAETPAVHAACDADDDTKAERHLGIQGGLVAALKEIRALAATPPPPVVPVAKDSALRGAVGSIIFAIRRGLSRGGWRGDLTATLSEWQAISNAYGDAP